MLSFINFHDNLYSYIECSIFLPNSINKAEKQKHTFYVYFYIMSLFLCYDFIISVFIYIFLTEGSLTFILRIRQKGQSV